MLTYNVDAFAEALGIFYFVLVYGVGILAMAFSVAAFQFRRRVTIIVFNFLGQSTWIAYFLLQGDVASAISCGLCAVMLAIYTQKGKWRWVASPIVLIGFVAILSGFSLLSFKTWSDVFPLAAGVFAVIANSRTSEKRLRQFSVGWCLSWLLNSAFKFYPVAFCNDLFCTVSTIVALIRYREKKAK